MHELESLNKRVKHEPNRTQERPKNMAKYLDFCVRNKLMQTLIEFTNDVITITRH